MKLVKFKKAHGPGVVYINPALIFVVQASGTVQDEKPGEVSTIFGIFQGDTWLVGHSVDNVVAMLKNAEADK